jgi:hypothetical protein
MVCLARRSLRHGRPRHHERARDLGGRQAAHRPNVSDVDVGDSAGGRTNSRSSVSSRSVAPSVSAARDLLAGRDRADDQHFAVAAGGVGAHLIGDAPDATAPARPGLSGIRAATAPPPR